MQSRFINRYAATIFLVMVAVTSIAEDTGTAGPAPMGDAEIEAIITRACQPNPGYAIDHYKGDAGRRYDFVGPLWLSTAGKKGALGVILPPFLRLYHYGTSRNCRKVSVEEARPLAGPEIWVVLWRAEDPPSPYRMRTTSDQRVLTPTEVKWRAGGKWHKPIWTRTRDSWISSWFGRDWNEKESLLAAFETLERDGALHVDYQVEEYARSYLTDSAVIPLTLFREKWWRLAHGEEPK